LVEASEASAGAAVLGVAVLSPAMAGSTEEIATVYAMISGHSRNFMYGERNCIGATFCIALTIPVS
ncbi:MAG: hypothetical protein C0508_27805, partial [Cyanobacteria bacterium PR.023]|nr:hypothetical protein [Cyanobacteria bacterium PR.023]